MKEPVPEGACSRERRGRTAHPPWVPQPPKPERQGNPPPGQKALRRAGTQRVLSRACSPCVILLLLLQVRAGARGSLGPRWPGTLRVSCNSWVPQGCRPAVGAALDRRRGERWEMRQQGHKSAEITIWHGPDRAGSNNCWERAPGYQQPVPRPRHECPVAGGAAGPFCRAVPPGCACVGGNPWGWDIFLGGCLR